MPRIMNIASAKEHRRALRRNATFTERLLWQALRSTTIPGVTFRRQVSIKHFILDFYAPKVKLAIELDGPSHDHPDAPGYDAWRQHEIEKLQIEIIRFRDEEVLENVGRVADKIEKRVREKLAEIKTLRES